jgi:hypothetical protein
MQSVYESVRQLHDDLKIYAVGNSCPFYVKNSSNSRFAAICRSPECNFALTAYRHKDGMIHIRKCHLFHSPYCSETKPASIFAIRKLTASHVDNDRNVEPKVLVNAMRNDHGVQTKYKTAWKALNQSKKEKKMEDDKSFWLLDHYLQLLEESNPGSHTSLELEADQFSFKRLFVCLYAAKKAFGYCRPMIIVDACHMKSEYRGIIMSACAHDGEGQVVGLAIGMAGVEDEANWTYFLHHLITAIPAAAKPGIVLMHDRHLGLQNAQKNIMPESYPSHCVFHIEKNLNSKFKSTFNRKIWEAAKATTPDSYDKAMMSISNMNPAAVEYLEGPNCDPSTWACSHFPVSRFGCVTSNSAESLNSWLRPLREGSHMNVLVCWVSHWASLFYNRFQCYNSMNEDLPPKAQIMMNENARKGTFWEVLRHSDSGFEVIKESTGIRHIVKLSENDCSCGWFEEFRFPCEHAAVALCQSRIPITSHVHHTYLLSSLKAVYKTFITPVSNIDIIADETTQPPIVGKQVGRRKKLRIRSCGEFESGQKQKVTCGLCGQEGHNRRSCHRRR